MFRSVVRFFNYHPKLVITFILVKACLVEISGATPQLFIPAVPYSLRFSSGGNLEYVVSRLTTRATAKLNKNLTSVVVDVADELGVSVPSIITYKVFNHEGNWGFLVDLVV
jgi:hypothetical protein